MPLEITRADWLISDLAFRKSDGEWLESEGWAEYISAGESRTQAVIQGLPKGKYSAVKFLVGLSPVTNGLNENQIPPGDPLHPLVNGLHWGWSDGFIFSAIEGRYGSKNEGFSYHLATSGNAVTIELAAEIETPLHSTLRIAFDLERFFKKIRPDEMATSSHSRGEDPLVPLMQEGIREGFSVVSVSTDRYQSGSLLEQPNTDDPGTIATTPLGTPYRLEVSERLPRVELPADNPLTEEGVALGRQLFFDKRLSGNNSQSCASCHQEDVAMVDRNKAFSIGSTGIQGDRNSMPLFNLAWHERFFWDGRAESLRQQVLMPIEDPKEMDQPLEQLIVELNLDAGLRAQFESAFGEGISNQTVAKALEQFLLTRLSQNSKFDRAARGETQLTAQEQKGLLLFVTEFDPKRNLFGADCFHCHGGNLFTNRRFTNNGLPPRDGDNLDGLYIATGKEVDRGKFKTPSLRNVAVTAPYMHDGRFATLKEVVQHYNSGVHRSATLDPNLAKHPTTGMQLSEQDQEALIAFLKALTDSTY